MCTQEVLAIQLYKGHVWGLANAAYSFNLGCCKPSIFLGISCHVVVPVVLPYELMRRLGPSDIACRPPRGCKVMHVYTDVKGGVEKCP